MNATPTLTPTLIPTLLNEHAQNAVSATPGVEERRSVADGTDGSQDALEALAAELGLEVVRDLRGRRASAAFLEAVPISYARRHGVLGLAGEPGEGEERGVLPVVFSSPAAWDVLDVLSRLLNRPVEPVPVPQEEVLRAINEAYGGRTGQADAFIERLDERRVLEEAVALGGREDLLDVDTRAPVIQLVNLVLFEAVKQLASDVHVQPYEEKLVVRFRIDGVLHDAHVLPRGLHEEVVSRLKVMGRMNIAEKRLPQDGRATVQVGDRTIDLRLSSVPTSHGERVVVRLLDKSAQLYSLEEIGMPPATLASFVEIIGVEHGLILLTGPTGSGKTTTLYAALQRINSKRSNVITLEDPIEYALSGVSQIQVATRKGMTFASGLRSVLRQDPDVIMVGEIRDAETATLAIQAALTGHLVFSTLHTNDAASAVTRLLDLGVEPYLVGSSLIAVLAQRLVRRVCSACGRSLNREEAALQLRRLHLDWSVDDERLDTVWVGLGCDACRHTGYRGRIGLFEHLIVDESIRRLIGQHATASQIKDAAHEAGMQTLGDAGLIRVLRGTTSVDEVVRVTMRSSGQAAATSSATGATPALVQDHPLTGEGETA